jgi:hypothetical protein
MAPRSVLNSTLQILAKKYIDSSFLAHPLFQAIEAAGNIKKVSGGARVEIPAMLGTHSTISQYTNGFESTDMTVKDPSRKALFEFADFSAPVMIARNEKLANKGDLAVVNILESRVKNVMLMLKQGVSRQIFVGDRTDLSSVQSLNGMGTSAAAASTIGWFEAAVAASQTNTVGTLSKTTFQSDGWFNQYATAGGTLTLEKLNSLMTACMLRNPSGDRPDMIFMSELCYSAFSALIEDKVRYTNAADAKGLDAQTIEMYRGARVFVDPNLGFANAAGDAVSAYVLTSSNFELYADEEGYFDMGELAPVSGTVTEAAQVYCRLQLVTGHLASHGVLIDAEA